MAIPNKKNITKIINFLNSCIPELGGSYFKADYYSAYTNYQRTITKRAKKYLRAKHLPCPLKKKDILVAFAQRINYNILDNSESLENQLIRLYLTGNHPELKRTANDQFYLSRTWFLLRKQVLGTYDNKCMCCGNTEKLHIDHIKPRSVYPALELEFDNLQILCQKCNIRKSNKVVVDYRPGAVMKAYTT